MLTRTLSQAHRVTAVEVDHRMQAVLAETAPQAELVLADALLVDLSGLLAALPQPRALVSNMPYHITGPLLKKFHAAASQYSLAVLMMQSEVAHKLIAPAGDSERGAVSVVLQSRFRIRKLCDAPAGAFLPPPKVDSCVLELTVTEPVLADHHLVIVREGFAQPRKTLANNLVSKGFDRQRVERALEAVRLSASVRPHQLEMSQWQALCQVLDS